jgi:hypothetical protein
MDDCDNMRAGSDQHKAGGTSRQQGPLWISVNHALATIKMFHRHDVKLF